MAAARVLSRERNYWHLLSVLKWCGDSGKVCSYYYNVK